MIISWDPGDVNTGCCMFQYDAGTRKANLMVIRSLKLPDVYKTLEMAERILPEGEKHTFVIENFRADVNNVAGRNPRGKLGGRSPGMFQWSEMKTSQMIGTLTYAAYRMNKSHVILQDPGQVLTMGRVWCDLKVPQKGHIPDEKSAYIHGAHYMMETGMIDTVDDIIKHGQARLM